MISEQIFVLGVKFEEETSRTFPTIPNKAWDALVQKVVIRTFSIECGVF